ncbi:MAG: DUF255 domain-containing protein [Pseudomonadota bacterium]|nr:DUF255 domain-containing protein [Pseudomonadota bacterium]MDP1906290.1 DUF255 domain-containing protein [Pseudomonadota bacterium]MDP2351657.1 DUF255 domain-containing protein [Pseudomonadota bacterium]
MLNKLFTLFLFGLSLAHAGESPLVNQLAGHPSPYLALHGKDPVVWQEWNAETLARAKRENKPLLVSVGYFACHWCHVMQRESFSDPAIAALLNSRFIPVKVDRELNLALDADLLAFTRQLHGVAGWPVNVFVTPEGYPFYAVLYQPPDKFKTVSEKLDHHWRVDSVGVRAAAQAATPARDIAANPIAADARDLAMLERRFLEAALNEADALLGGFGAVSKFPNVAKLRALLDLQARSPEPRLREFLLLTLDNMARLGLHDPVNGGFFRYTTDPDWHTPHFEKMLYDNAQLALLYARAAEVLKRPDYRDHAHETLDFLLEVLGTREGGFRTSASALDSQGREGGAYLWRPAELRKRLTPEQVRLVRRVWGTGSHFDLGDLPMEQVPPSAAERPLLAAAHARLKAAGRMRDLPRDGKLNAGLNGLALSAFSLAGRGVPKYEQAARRLRDFIDAGLLRNGQLLKSRVGKNVFADAELDDYAYLAQGLLDHAGAFDDAGSRVLADTLLRQAWDRFFTPEGWRRETHPLLATAASHAALPDEATPSPSATLIRVSLNRPGTAPPEALNRALAHATRSALADPLSHPGILAVLRARFAPAQ